MQGYILFISPALFIITAYFFFELKNKLRNQPNKKWIRIVSVFLLIAIVVLPIRYCFERTGFGFNAARHESYVDDYKKFIDKLNEKSVVLNVMEPIEFMFYNNCIAYSISEISIDEKNSIGKKGFKIFYFDQTDKTIKLME